MNGFCNICKVEISTQKQNINAVFDKVTKKQIYVCNECYKPASFCYICNALCLKSNLIQVKPLLIYIGRQKPKEGLVYCCKSCHDHFY